MKKKPKMEKVTLTSISKSIDDLAIITERGFSRAVSKEEFKEFKEEITDFAKKTNLTLFNIDSKLQTVDQQLDAIEKTLGPLVHVSNAVQRELREHNERIMRIEHKIGLATK